MEKVLEGAPEIIRYGAEAGEAGMDLMKTGIRGEKFGRFMNKWDYKMWKLTYLHIIAKHIYEVTYQNIYSVLSCIMVMGTYELTDFYL